MTDSPGRPPQRPFATAETDPLTSPGLRDQRASELSQVVRGRAAYPGAAPTAPSFDDEISAAVSYEKGLAVKALVAIALVILVLALRQFVFI